MTRTRAWASDGDISGCATIISRTNDEGIRTLARNMIKDIDFIGRLSSWVSKNLWIGSTAFAKVRDWVGGIFSEPENTQYSKKSENITDFINNIYSGWFSRDITLSILRDTTKEYIAPIKQDDFFWVITNIFQNAIRYKKDEQVQWILNISFKSENGYLILVFHDFGKWIRDIDIDACLWKREFATEKPHKDSQRVGFSSVRDTIKKHNGKINIESNRSLVESWISKDETYTKIIIEIPLKSS